MNTPQKPETIAPFHNSIARVLNELNEEEMFDPAEAQFAGNSMVNMINDAGQLKEIIRTLLSNKNNRGHEVLFWLISRSEIPANHQEIKDSMRRALGDTKNSLANILYERALLHVENQEKNKTD